MTDLVSDIWRACDRPGAKPVGSAAFDFSGHRQKAHQNQRVAKLRRKGGGTQRHLTSVYFRYPASRPSEVRHLASLARRRHSPSSGGRGALAKTANASSSRTSMATVRSFAAFPTRDLARRLKKRRCVDRLQSVFVTEVDRTTVRLKARWRRGEARGRSRCHPRRQQRAQPRSSRFAKPSYGSCRAIRRV